MNGELILAEIAEEEINEGGIERTKELLKQGLSTRCEPRNRRQAAGGQDLWRGTWEGHRVDAQGETGHCPGRIRPAELGYPTADSTPGIQGALHGQMDSSGR